jgi:acyl-CoA synthetase (AMP-forming)/AMP-acid ligase II
LKEDAVRPIHTLHDPIRRGVEGLATVFGGWTRTAGECSDRVSLLAGALRGFGILPGDRVGILAANSDRYHEVLLAVSWAGAAVAPLGIRWSIWQIRRSLRQSGIRVLFIDDSATPMLRDLRAGWDGLSTVVHCGDTRAPEGCTGYEELVAHARPVSAAPRSGEDVFGIFSDMRRGGELKHTVVTHARLLSAGGRNPLAGGRVLHATPLYLLAEATMWAAGVLSGAAHVIVPEFSAPAVLAAIDRHSVTDVRLEPARLRVLLDEPGFERHDLSSVRQIRHDDPEPGEPLADSVHAAFPNAELRRLTRGDDLAAA